MRSTRSQKSISSQKARSTTPAQRKKKVDVSSDEEEVKSSTRKLASNRSNMRRKRSQAISPITQIVFHKGTYVAFVDPSEMNQFKIGLLLSDLKEEEDEALMDIFKEIAPLLFQKQAARQSVPEYTIFTDVIVVEEKSAKRGEKPKIRINKQQANKANKLMDAAKKSEVDEDDEDDEDEEEDEEDEEEDEDEDSKVMKVDGKKEIQARRIIKAKTPNISQARKPTTQSNQRKASAAKKQDLKKKAQPKSKSRSPSKKSKKAADEEMDEEEEEKEEDSEPVMIDTSKKNQKQKKAATLPKVGQKRLRTSKKHMKNNDSEQEPSGEADEDGGSFDEEDSSQPVKKRKMTGGKEKVVKSKNKKAPKMPTVFKKGKWNPDVQIIMVEKYLEEQDNEPYLDCCIRCNNKNVIRAAQTNNEKLLKKCIDETKKISSLTAYWGCESQWTALEIIIKNNLYDMLEILLHPKVKVPPHSTYESVRDITFNQRVNNPQYLKNVIDTGMVSHMAYGARVRKVQQTRGNRQGDNAFLEYLDNYQRNPVYLTGEQKFMKKLFYYPSVEYDTYKQLYKLHPHIEAFYNSNAYEAVRAGNRKVAYELIKNMVKHPNFGFNQLHVDVLGNDQISKDKILKQSVQKKANTNRDITPLHCACINPNPKYLKQLLDTNPDLIITDQDMMKPVHYAAACEGPEPLEILIQAGATVFDPDNQKRTPIHIAAMTGRAHNVRTILNTAPGQLNLKDKKGMNAMAYACKFGHIEVIKVLLEFKVRINSGYGLQRMPPLSWAAAYGHYELCEFLIENKARTLGKDKFKRNALIMACRNGHSKIASLLLQRGSEWIHEDSSKNTALHYAAGYGSLDCIELLLKAGADVNHQNSWKTSPINIAMLKNHHGCVKRLLEEPNVNVNGKDDKGRTLIMLSLLMLDEESEDFISYLLRKGADPNIADLEGETSLHYLAKYQPRQHDHQGQLSKAVYLQQIEYQKKLAQILIQHGADLTIKDNQKRTPFTICLNNDNAPLLDFLKDKVSLNREPELLFAFKDKIFDMRYQRILERIILNDPPLKETINFLDDNGFTPFLTFLKSFIEKQAELNQKIQQQIQEQSFVNGADIDRYHVTNEDLFEKFKEANPNTYGYNALFTQEMKIQLTHKIFEDIIVKPFIKILSFLIDQGADCYAQVGKMKKYREIELKKRQMIQDIAEGKDVKMEKEEEKIKKREEKMEEVRKRHRKNLPFRGKAFGAPFGQNLILAQNQQNEEKDVYEMRNGEKVLREYNQFGLRNAIHMIIQHPQETLLNYILSLNINPDQPDYDEITPFNLLSQYGDTRHEQSYKHAFDKFLDLNVRIDYPDIKGRTPFLNFYDKHAFEIAYTLVDMGANVNQMDTSGMFALKYALIRRQNDKIKELLDRGANINLIDNKNRNLLHYAINMSSATADATFETEQFLIENGVDINLKDYLHRTPLHYAFVKIDDWKNCSQIDPIETVSSICGYKGLELDVPDKWLKTPLHYASQRGASICAMYLIQRGADMERKDIYGNTCLGVALMNGHYNYGIILIQKQASVHPLVFKEDPERIKKMWEEEEKQQKKLYKVQKKGEKPGLDVQMEENMQSEKRKKKHRNLFDKSNQQYYDYYDEEYDEEDSEDYDNQYGYQETVFNQQNPFNMNVYNNPKIGLRKVVVHNPGFVQNQNQTNLVMEQDKEGVSNFKIAIRGGQQGLAYLMLDNGYDLMLAMQDAMDEKKFMLVLTLLSKNPNDEVIQQKNKKNQNLFHILAMNAASCSIDHLKRIYETFLKRRVDVKAVDNYGRNALHYAVLSQSIHLVEMLLNQENKYDPNQVDQDGHTPLSLLLKGKYSENEYYYPMNPGQKTMFSLLAKSGSDVNFIYPEEIFKPALKEEEVHDPNYDPKGKYYCTPLINLIRQNPKNEIIRQNLIGLIEFGARLDVLDSDGRDPIMHAIINNNTMVVKILLENKNNLHYNTYGQDKSGKSTAHYVVTPLRFGSFENVEILNLLHQYGFNLNLKDNNSKSPTQYAAEQESGILLKELAKLTGQDNQLAVFRRAISMVETQQWPESKVDFEQDAEEFMDKAHENEKQLAKEKEFRVPVDKTGNFEKSHSVYYDDNDHPWDVYLTKVDLKNGIYGDYVFYKMQLLFDSNKELYIVFTRWGRIGENGMNQRTPFNNLDEAKQEFKKIFKQKTGGNDFEALDTFSRVKKKYNHTKVNYITCDYKDYLQPFDFEKCPKTRLSEPIYDLFEEISNVTMYQRAMSQFGLDTSVLPFSSVKKESIVEARTLLMNISELMKEDQEISKQGINADYDQLTQIKEKLCELSSRYYELIPLAKYKDQIAPPITNQHLLKTQYDLIDGLSNIEFASKILLGALLRQNELNPIDYVYNALNLLIEPLDQEGPEYEVIRKYIDNTSKYGEGWNAVNLDNFEIAHVFKFQRKGEAEMIQAFKEVPNHFLLFHGSAMFNYIGILSQGLRIAPPEAPVTGYMFGKGVYFADMFSKSFAYAQRGYQQQDSHLMLMCEVVLGKSREFKSVEYIENLEYPFHSVKGCGYQGPGYKHTITCPNGVKIPLGKVIFYHENEEERRRLFNLNHNEYIVYNTAQIRMRYLVQIKKKKNSEEVK